MDMFFSVVFRAGRGFTWGGDAVVDARGGAVRLQ